MAQGMTYSGDINLTSTGARYLKRLSDDEVNHVREIISEEISKAAKAITERQHKPF